jgi:hypothetical protein
MGFSFRKADLCHHIYRNGDPDKYGSVCPHCQKRWGKTKVAGFIDIERCPSCPSFELMTIVGARKDSKKKAKERANAQSQGTIVPRVSSSDLLRRL